MYYYYVVTCPINGVMDDGLIHEQYMCGLYMEHAACGYITSYTPMNNTTH